MSNKQKEKKFSVRDPFNKNNFVEGKVIIGGRAYGDLLITRVNGFDCEQYIHCTPKFKYPGNNKNPFVVSGKDLATIKYDDVRVWEKIDGTNILLWKYVDENGKQFVSFKTRLVPFLSDDGYSTWITMWKQMLKKYDKIVKLYGRDTGNWAFELYGAVNKIIIDYTPVMLDCTLLYEIDDCGNLFDHPEIDWLPRPKRTPWTFTDFESGYRTLETEVEKSYLEKKDIEGHVIYIEKERRCTPYKCKARSILAEQMEGSIGISVKEIYTTAINAYESGEDVIDLLREVYPTALIEKSIETIERVARRARRYVKLRSSVIRKYKELDLDINGNKRDTMRTIMQYFPRDMSSMVYTIIVGIFGKDKNN